MALGVCHEQLFPKTMKRYILLIVLSIFSLNAIHADISWTLSGDGTLTISGTDMLDYNVITWLGEQTVPWNSQKKSIKKVVIKNGVTNIGSFAFYDCSYLTSITIPNSVTSIGRSAFENCKGLTSITIPNSVTNSGYHAFYGSSGFTSIIVEKGNTKYDSRNDCNAIIEKETNTLIAGCKKTIIPNTVTSIGDYAFSNCRALTSITIPKSVKSLGEQAFSYCSDLTSITIPNSVTSIGKEAFIGCI